MRRSDKLALGAATALLLAGFLWLALPAAALAEPASAAATANGETALPLAGTATERMAVPSPEAALPPEDRGRARPALTHVAVPAGTIEVVAQSEEGPPPRGVAVTYADDDNIRKVALDADGVARIGALAPGFYGVWLELVGGQTVGTSGWIRLEPESGLRRVFRFGSASVHGTVYGADGKRMRGIGVQVEGEGWFGCAETDAMGHYEVGGLTAGTRSVTVVRDDIARLSLGEELYQHVHHSPHAARCVDFGCPSGLVSWSGAVRTTTGAPLLAPARIRLRRVGDERSVELQTRADGSFALLVEPGTWGVTLMPPRIVNEGFGDWGGQSREPVEIAAAPVHRDLTLTGTRVRVRVRVTGSHPVDLDRLVVCAQIRRFGLPRFNAAHVGDGNYVLDGLPAGTWTLGCPRALTADCEIVVRPADVELEADLEVR